MRNTKINKRKEKIYLKKLKVSCFLWLLAGLGVLAFGIYLMDIFEIIGSILLIIISIVQFISINKSKNSNPIKKERSKLGLLSLAIILFSLINPIGILPAIYDIFKRDWVIRGGLDE